MKKQQLLDMLRDGMSAAEAAEMAIKAKQSDILDMKQAGADVEAAMRQLDDLYRSHQFHLLYLDSILDEIDRLSSMQ